MTAERMFTLDEYEDVKRRAYLAGLDAAREAVAALYESAGKYAQDMIDPDDALAAIDALRDLAILAPDDRNAGTGQIADSALHKSPRQDR